MEKRTIYVRQLFDLYLEDKISMQALAEIAEPLAGHSIEEKEKMAQKILLLAKKAKNEQELINLVKEERFI